MKSIGGLQRGLALNKLAMMGRERRSDRRPQVYGLEAAGVTTCEINLMRTLKGVVVGDRH